MMVYIFTMFGLPSNRRFFHQYARSFSTGLEIQALGYIGRKTEQVLGTFQSYNFSFIIKGNGTYRYQNKNYTVKAPCVLTQAPDIYMDYGPDDSWEELFFIYKIKHGHVLYQRNYLQMDQPFWLIQNPKRFYKQVEQFFGAIQGEMGIHIGDEADFICEALLRASVYQRNYIGIKPSKEYILKINQYLDDHLDERIDWLEICDKHSIQPSKFRREWKNVFGLAPIQSLLLKRIQLAKNLLLETTLSVKEIASICGYEDEFYFYRLFRKKENMTAVEFRNIYRDKMQFE